MMKKGALKKEGSLNKKKEKQDKILQIWDSLIDKMVDKIIETCVVDGKIQEQEWTFCCKHFLNETQIREEIVMERNLSKKCGNPSCLNSIPSTEEFLSQFPSHQKAKIDFATNQIINIREDFNFLYFRFCSDSCKSIVQHSISTSEATPKSHFQIYSELFQVPQIIHFISKYFPNLNISSLQLLKQKLQEYLNSENELLLKKNKITVKLQVTEREDPIEKMNNTTTKVLTEEERQSKSKMVEGYTVEKKVTFEQQGNRNDEETQLEVYSEEDEDEQEDEDDSHEDVSQLLQKFTKNPLESSDDEEYQEDLKQSRLYLQKPSKFIFLSNIVMDWHSDATEHFFDVEASAKAEELHRMRMAKRKEEEELKRKLESFAKLAKEEMNVDLFDESSVQHIEPSSTKPRKRISNKTKNESIQPTLQQQDEEKKIESTQQNQTAPKIKFVKQDASQNQEDDGYFDSLLIQRQKIALDNCLKTLPEFCSLLHIPYVEILSDLFKDLIKSFSFNRVFPSLQNEDWVILNSIFFLSLRSKLTLKEHILKCDMNLVYGALIAYCKNAKVEVLTQNQVELLLQTVIKGYKL